MSAVAWTVVVAASFVCASFDVRTRRIPNWLCLALFLGGLGWSAYLHGMSGLAMGALTSVVMATPYLILFLFAHGGGGDAKFMGAVGPWLGLRAGVTMLAAVALSGAVLAVIFAAVRRHGETLAAPAESVAGRPRVSGAAGTAGGNGDTSAPAPGRALQMPYGPAIFVGACIATGVSLWRG